VMRGADVVGGCGCCNEAFCQRGLFDLKSSVIVVGSRVCRWLWVWVLQ